MFNNIYSGRTKLYRCEMYPEDGTGKAKDDSEKYPGRTVVSCTIDKCPYENLREFDQVCRPGGLVEFPDLFKKLERIAESSDSQDSQINP